jgi:hypothetical protein
MYSHILQSLNSASLNGNISRVDPDRIDSFSRPDRSGLLAGLIQTPDRTSSFKKLDFQAELNMAKEKLQRFTTSYVPFEVKYNFL